MTINFTAPEQDAQLKPRITVFGVGGAGGNAVNNMISKQLEGVDFVVANTDAQAIAQSQAERRVQLGVSITHGLGAGARPDMGRAAAEEAIDDITQHLNGSHMVFIAAGMGGGTGTGAAPVIARLAREQGMLTVGVVTKPFQFEGSNRMRIADAGIEEMQQFVDTLIVIPNQNLFRIANEKTTFADAFAMADDVLHSGVRGVTDLMVVPGLINLDFADIRSVMSEMGKAMMGTGEADGEERARLAAEAAISNPLLDDVSMRGARGVLINITGGPDMTLFEVDEAANRIGEEVDAEANIIFGSAQDPALEGKIRVSVVATGIDIDANARPRPVLRVMEEPPAQPKRIDPAPAEAERGPAASLIDVMEKKAEAEIPEPVPAAAETSAETPAAIAEKESFIPPEPVAAPKKTVAEKAPDPFREADLVNAAPPAPKKRASSLLQRVTEAAWPRREQAAEKPAAPPMPPRPAKPAPAPAAAKPAPVAAPEPKPEPVPESVAERAEPVLKMPEKAAESVPVAEPRLETRPAPEPQPDPEIAQEPATTPEPEPMPEPVAETPAPVAEPPAPVAEPPAPVEELPKPAAQQSLKGVSASDSPQSEEDLLDIPAFLRRQAN